MNPGKNVLLAEINSLNPSEKYMQYVVKLAKDLKKPVKFLHVFNPELYPIGIPYITGDQVQFSSENLAIITSSVMQTMQQIDKRIRSEISEIPETSLISEVGLPLDIVNRQLQESSIVLITVEGNSHDGDFDVFSDENMDIIRKSDIPVLVIPVDFEYKPLRKIIYATDYNDEDVSTLKRTIEFAKYFSSEIIAVHITDNIDFKERIEAEGFEKMVQEKTGYQKIKFETIVPEKESLGDVLNGFIRSVNGDLLVMLKENKNFYQEIFTRSHVKDALQHVHIPLLVYHQRRHVSG